MNRIVEAARHFVQQVEISKNRLGSVFPANAYDDLRDAVAAGAHNPEPLSALAEAALRTALVHGKASDAVALHALLVDLRKAEVTNG